MVDVDTTPGCRCVVQDTKLRILRARKPLSDGETTVAEPGEIIDDDADDDDDDDVSEWCEVIVDSVMVS